jgi:transposase
VWDAYLVGADLWLGAQRRAVAAFGASQAGQEEHELALEHEFGRDGTISSGGGSEDTAVVFETYVEQVLAPSLCPGQVVVMDNLGAHRPKRRVRELIEGRGCELVYLPAYSSPDYNPIDEEAFAKIKNLLGKAAARTKEALVEAIGSALCAISAQDASWGFFEHAGYHPVGQLL